MSYLLIALGALTRIIPHSWNFTPIGSIGLFAGAYGNPRSSWAVPLVALLISDAFIGFYDFRVMLAVYFGFLAGPLLGRLLLRQRRSLARFGLAVFSTATIFFIVSNLGVWAAYHPLTIAGLIECYVLALPFYGAMLIGDTLFAAILFGGRELFERHRTATGSASPAV